MTNNNGFHTGDPPPGHGPSGTGEAESILKIVKHVTLALCAHVRRLHQDALPVPDEVEELAIFLMRLAKMGPGAATLAGESGATKYDRMQDRLLVTKGESGRAARRLSQNSRTLGRDRRLSQVRVERLARFRVRDLEACRQPGRGPST